MHRSNGSRYGVVLCCAAVAAAIVGNVAPALANVTNDIPYQASFETNVPGTVIGMDGWYSANETAAVVVAETYDYRMARTLEGETHTNVLVYTATASNLFSYASANVTNVWVDLMVKPAFSTVVPVDVPDDVLTACYFGLDANSNGQMFVLHTAWTTDFNLENLWTPLAHTPVVSGEWVRVTIKTDYLTDVMYDGGVNKYFQIQINGGPAITNARAHTTVPPEFDEETFTIVTNGTWFLAYGGGYGGGPTQLNALVMMGKGEIDDLLVSDAATTAETVWTIAASAGTNGAIFHNGTVTVPDGWDIPFAVTADPEFMIGEVTVDGSPISVPSRATELVYWFSNVTADATISATFVTTNLSPGVYTPNGTAITWLESFDLGPEDDDQDGDGDGALTWEEYVAGTDPTSSASVFRVLDIEFFGASNVVSWYGTDDSGVTNAFSMWRNTNGLISPVWDLVASNNIAPRAADGTNTWVDTTPPTGPTFYRPGVIWFWEP